MDNQRINARLIRVEVNRTVDAFLRLAQFGRHDEFNALVKTASTSAFGNLADNQYKCPIVCYNQTQTNVHQMEGRTVCQLE